MRISTLSMFRQWIRDIPEPSYTIEDHGIGHYEVHGKTGFDSQPTRVLDDKTTGPFICYLNTPNPEDWITHIFNILEDEGRNTLEDVRLDGSITFKLTSYEPAKVELYWVEDY